MSTNKIISASFDTFHYNRDILETIINPELNFKWIEVDDVIHVYKGMVVELGQQPIILHEQLISDAVYEPIKDILFYESQTSVFSRICKFTYLIGHAVGTCNIQLMITLFNALYTVNYNTEHFYITSELIDVFTKAYNKEIHLEAFEGFLTEMILNDGWYEK